MGISNKDFNKRFIALFVAISVAVLQVAPSAYSAVGPAETDPGQTTSQDGVNPNDVPPPAPSIEEQEDPNFSDGFFNSNALQMVDHSEEHIPASSKQIEEAKVVLGDAVARGVIDKSQTVVDGPEVTTFFDINDNILGKKEINSWTQEASWSEVKEDGTFKLIYTNVGSQIETTETCSQEADGCLGTGCMTSYYDYAAFPEDHIIIGRFSHSRTNDNGDVVTDTFIVHGKPAVEEIEPLQRVLHAFDKDNSNTVSPSELIEGIAAFYNLFGTKIGDENFNEMYDFNGDGYISANDTVPVSLMIEDYAEPLAAETLQTFNVIDSDNNYEITAKEMVEALAKFYEHFSSREGDANYNALYDFDGDGRININDTVPVSYAAAHLLSTEENEFNAFTTMDSNGNFQLSNEEANAFLEELLKVISGQLDAPLEQFDYNADGLIDDVDYNLFRELAEKYVEGGFEPEYPGVIDLNGRIVSVDMEGLINGIKEAWEELKNSGVDGLDEDVMGSLLQLKGIGDVFTQEDLSRFNRDLPYCPPGASCVNWQGGEWPFSHRGWIEFATELLSRYDQNENGLDIFDTSVTHIIAAIDNEKVLDLVINGIVREDPRVERFTAIALRDLSNTTGLTMDELKDLLESADLKEDGSGIVLNFKEGKMHDGRLIDVLGDGAMPNTVEYSLQIIGQTRSLPPSNLYGVQNVVMKWHEGNNTSLNAGITYQDGRIASIQWSRSPIDTSTGCENIEEGLGCDPVPLHVGMMLHKDTYQYNEDGTLTITRSNPFILYAMADAVAAPSLAAGTNAVLVEEVMVDVAYPYYPHYNNDTKIMTLERRVDGRMHIKQLLEYDNYGRKVTTDFNYIEAMADCALEDDNCSNNIGFASLISIVRTSAGDDAGNLSTTEIRNHKAVVTTMMDGVEHEVEFGSLEELLSDIRTLENAARENAANAAIDEAQGLMDVLFEDSGIVSPIHESQLEEAYAKVQSLFEKSREILLDLRKKLDALGYGHYLNYGIYDMSADTQTATGSLFIADEYALPVDAALWYPRYPYAPNYPAGAAQLENLTSTRLNELQNSVVNADLVITHPQTGVEMTITSQQMKDLISRIHEAIWDYVDKNQAEGEWPYPHQPEDLLDIFKGLDENMLPDNFDYGTWFHFGIFSQRWYEVLMIAGPTQKDLQGIAINFIKENLEGLFDETGLRVEDTLKLMVEGIPQEDPRIERFKNVALEELADKTGLSTEHLAYLTESIEVDVDTLKVIIHLKEGKMNNARLIDPMGEGNLPNVVEYTIQSIGRTNSLPPSEIYGVAKSVMTWNEEDGKVLKARISYDGLGRISEILWEREHDFEISGVNCEPLDGQLVDCGVTTTAKLIEMLYRDKYLHREDNIFIERGPAIIFSSVTASSDLGDRSLAGADNLLNDIAPISMRLPDQVMKLEKVHGQYQLVELIENIKNVGQIRTTFENAMTPGLCVDGVDFGYCTSSGVQVVSLKREHVLDGHISITQVRGTSALVNVNGYEVSIDSFASLQNLIDQIREIELTPRVEIVHEEDFGDGRFIIEKSWDEDGLEQLVGKIKSPSGEMLDAFNIDTFTIEDQTTKNKITINTTDGRTIVIRTHHAHNVDTIDYYTKHEWEGNLYTVSEQFLMRQVREGYTLQRNLQRMINAPGGTGYVQYTFYRYNDQGELVNETMSYEYKANHVAVSVVNVSKTITNGEANYDVGVSRYLNGKQLSQTLFNDVASIQFTDPITLGPGKLFKGLSTYVNDEKKLNITVREDKSLHFVLFIQNGNLASVIEIDVLQALEEAQEFADQITAEDYDINRDGLVDEEDILLADQKLKTYIEITNWMDSNLKKIFDVNGDGEFGFNEQGQIDFLNDFSEDFKEILNRIQRAVDTVEIVHEMAFGDGRFIIEKELDENGNEILTARFQAPEGDEWKDLRVFDIGRYTTSTNSFHDNVTLFPANADSEWSKVDILRGNVQHYAQNFTVHLKRDDALGLSYRYELVKVGTETILQLDAQLTSNPEQNISYHYNEEGEIYASDTNRSVGNKFLRYRDDVGSDRHLISIYGSDFPSINMYLTEVVLTFEDPQEFKIIKSIQGINDEGHLILIEVTSESYKITDLTEAAIREIVERVNGNLSQLREIVIAEGLDQNLDGLVNEDDLVYVEDVHQSLLDGNRALMEGLRQLLEESLLDYPEEASLLELLDRVVDIESVIEVKQQEIDELRNSIREIIQERAQKTLQEIRSIIAELEALVEELGGVRNENAPLEKQLKDLRGILNGTRGGPIPLNSLAPELIAISMHYLVLGNLRGFEVQLAEAIENGDQDKANKVVQWYEAYKKGETIEFNDGSSATPIILGDFDNPIEAALDELNQMIARAIERGQVLPHLIVEAEDNVQQRRTMWEGEAMRQINAYSEFIATLEPSLNADGIWGSNEWMLGRFEEGPWTSLPTYDDEGNPILHIRPAFDYEAWIESRPFVVTLHNGASMIVRTRNGAINPDDMESLRILVQRGIALETLREIKNAISEIEQLIEELGVLEEEIAPQEKELKDLNEILEGRRGDMFLLGLPESIRLELHPFVIEALKKFEMDLDAAIVADDMDVASRIVAQYKAFRNDPRTLLGYEGINQFYRADSSILDPVEFAKSFLIKRIKEAREKLDNFPSAIEEVQRLIKERREAWEAEAKNTLESYSDLIKSVNPVVGADGNWGSDMWVRDYFYNGPWKEYGSWGDVVFGSPEIWVESRPFEVTLMNGEVLKVESRNGIVDPKITGLFDALRFVTRSEDVALGDVVILRDSVAKSTGPNLGGNHTGFEHFLGIKRKGVIEKMMAVHTPIPGGRNVSREIKIDASVSLRGITDEVRERSDVNKDGDLNPVDIDYLYSHLSRSGWSGENSLYVLDREGTEDVNQDGAVNVIDLILVMAAVHTKSVVTVDAEFAFGDGLIIIEKMSDYQGDNFTARIMDHNGDEIISVMLSDYVIKTDRRGNQTLVMAPIGGRRITLRGSAKRASLRIQQKVDSEMYDSVDKLTTVQMVNGRVHKTNERMIYKSSFIDRRGRERSRRLIQNSSWRYIDGELASRRIAARSADGSSITLNGRMNKKTGLWEDRTLVYKTTPKRGIVLKDNLTNVRFQYESSGLITFVTGNISNDSGVSIEITKATIMRPLQWMQATIQDPAPQILSETAGG